MTRLARLLLLAFIAVVALSLSQPERAFAATFVVTTTGDSGPGSLRQAILDANSNAGLDSITFSIGSGAQTITPASTLPFITDPVVIDGTSQPGFSGAPIIELNGQNVTVLPVGLRLDSGDSTIRGLVINRFISEQIEIGTMSAGGNTIQGNYVGTTVDGMSRTPFTGTAVVVVGGSNNVIGGAPSADRNVIDSDNFSEGVFIGSPSFNNTVRGNYIGVDATGSTLLGTVHDGIEINDSSGNVIDGNVIAGGEGLRLMESTTGNVVRNNLIGTDAAGASVLGNSQPGVSILAFAGAQASNNTIGPGNVIGGNNIDGIITAGNVVGNSIQGNYIGTNSVGADLGNSGDGISVGAGVSVSGNIIAHNTGAGVSVYGNGVPISGNSIHSNGGVGILLESGANDGQQAPTISTATTNGSTTTITGSLASGPSASFTVEFFSNTVCDGSGAGEGQLFLGSASATTDASGIAAFSRTFAGDGTATIVTTTATSASPSNDTSAFSSCLAVTVDNSPTPTPTVVPSVGGIAELSGAVAAQDGGGGGDGFLFWAVGVAAAAIVSLAGCTAWRRRGKS